MNKGLVVAALGAVQHVRRVIPARYVPVLVRRRLDQAWQVPAFVSAQEEQMRFLLEFTERADEVPELARGYAEQAMLRSYLRWHPRAITRQRVEGVESLTSRRDPGRGVVVSFMHHGHYGGMFASLARVGARCKVLVASAVLRPDTPAALKQHVRVLRRGAEIIATHDANDARESRVDAAAKSTIASIHETLRSGGALAIASDVPIAPGVAGCTPVTFLGRRVLASNAAARIAWTTNSPVVLVTARHDRAGAYLQVEEPLEPRSFDGPAGLFDEMLRRHEEAVLAWPEALDTPRARWGLAAD